MRWFVISCVLAGCISDDTPRFADKGQGLWVEVPETPALEYRAVWGAHAEDVFAVGDGAVHFDGRAWTIVDDVPVATYRAIWGRSKDQIWIGGDGVLLARELTGWQPQLVFDHDQPITEFSVLAIAGDDASEYAVLRTGGKLLLVINRGSSWETPYWRSGEALPFAVHPSVHASRNALVLAGDGTLTDVLISTDLGVALWETRSFAYDVADGVSVLGGASDEYVAAGPDRVVFRFGIDDPIAVFEDRELAIARNPHGVSMHAGHAFVVGERIEVGQAKTTSSVAASSIEACDVDGCRLERIAGDRGAPLQAVWSDDSGHAIAVGDGWIVHRTSCGSLRCELD
ncbi:MAG: hypothetical protein ABI867_15215 [Kofleriaceae bacterium]